MPLLEQSHSLQAISPQKREREHRWWIQNDRSNVYSHLSRSGRFHVLAVFSRGRRGICCQLVFAHHGAAHKLPRCKQCVLVFRFLLPLTLAGPKFVVATQRTKTNHRELGRIWAGGVLNQYSGQTRLLQATELHWHDDLYDTRIWPWWSMENILWFTYFHIAKFHK